MKKYLTPVCDVLTLATQDIVLTSGEKDNLCLWNEAWDLRLSE